MAKQPAVSNNSHSFKVSSSIVDRLRDDLIIWGMCLGLVTLLVAVYFLLEGASIPLPEIVETSEVAEMPVGLPQEELNP